MVKTNLEDYYLETSPGLVVSGTAPAGEKVYVFEGRDGARRLGARAENPRPAAELALGEEDWTFQPQSEIVEVPYARMASDPEGRGESQGWHTAAFDDARWHEQWLSPERFTVRDWLVLGPFDDPPRHGFNVAFGPELDGARIDVAKSYAALPPSPPAPLPKGEGRKTPSPPARLPKGEGRRWRRLQVLPSEAVSVLASSEWGAGYGAAHAADGVVDQNGNYWQTRQGQDRGAWWQRNLGAAVPIRAIEIAWARYQDRVHCPPARIEIQVSPTAAAGPWRKVLEIGPQEIPADGQPYQSGKRWRYPLPAGVSAQHVRLTFPEGSQPKARFPGYLCLGEVEVETAGPLPAAKEESPQDVAAEPAPWVVYTPIPRGPTSFGLPDVFSYATYVTPIFGRGSAAYFGTFVFSPSDRTVQLQIASENAKVWVNGQKVLSFYLPGYVEDRAGWAQKRDVRLQKGWNEILLKLARPAHPSFYFRLVGADGQPMGDVVVSTRKSLPSPASVRWETLRPSPPLAGGFRWYRAAIPPGTVACKVPRATSPWTVYVNGRPRPAENGLVRFPDLDAAKNNLLALKINAGEELSDYLQFVSGPTRYRLGCWTPTGLANYSGAASYEKDFSLPPEFRGKRIFLDCGEVGVTAEVWLNGKRVGERAWKPFRLQITEAVRPGSNHLKIVVRNTEANARAVEGYRPLLKNIHLNGLHGPVRIVPYVDLSMPLSSMDR